MSMEKSKKAMCFAVLVAISTVGAAGAQDININSWSDLISKAQDLNNKYILNEGVTPYSNSNFKIGSWNSGYKGSWNLDGNNVLLTTGSHIRSGFSIENNINSFVFENLNIDKFKNDNGPGGVIWNGGTGGVLQNSTISNSGARDGGVIYNNASFDRISGNKFNNNFVNYGNGGVIYNNGNIAEISDNIFNNNGAYDGDAKGGAIYNNENATITKIDSSKFTNNQSAREGGAIYNNGTIGAINNSTFGEENSGNIANEGGGAIYNNSTIGDIVDSSFSYNGLRWSGKNGGAIFNNGSINSIKNSNFNYNGNKIDGFSDDASVGGAIYNNGTIGVAEDNTTGIVGGAFVGNQAQYGGGAVFNDGIIHNITGVKFDSNYSGDEGGGAIKNKNIITTISDSIFENNRADTALGNVLDGKGGAIYNIAGANIKEIKSSRFYSNVSNDFGGAISNFGVIEHIDNSEFGAKNKGNQGASAGAINNQDGGQINKITNSTFSNNRAIETSDYVQGYGGAIINRSWQSDNMSKIGLIDNVIFSNNEANGLKEEYRNGEGSVYGGAIYNELGLIGTISNSSFVGNNVLAGDDAEKGYKGTAKGGAIANINGNIESIRNTSFDNNFTSGTDAYGGAIYNESVIGNIDADGNLTGGIVNSSFKGNHAETSSGIAKGGAIYTSKDLNIIADSGYTSLFTDNYIENEGVKEQNAIYVETLEDSNTVTLTLDASSKSKIVFNDTIDGNKYNLNLTGDSSGNIYINNKVLNADISQSDVTSIVSEASNLNYNNSLAINSGIMNITHLGMEPLMLRSFSNDGVLNINSVDIDVAGEKMGQITAENYGSMNGTINVNNLNVLTSPVKDKTTVLFADQAFANTVKYNGAKEYASPLYKYGITYIPETGEFQFLKGAGISQNSANAYSPSVYVSSVATQVGGYLTQSQTLQDAFYHMNRYTKYARNMRFAAENPNTYAIAENSLYGKSVLPETSSAMWVKPYTAFEKVNLKGGIGVSNVTYGTLYGGDTDLYDLGHGYKGVISAFVGYNGAHQSYNGISMNQQGGTIGITGTLYKGNFFTGLTMSAGASAGEAYTPFGRDNFAMLTSGVASKSGYNWEIKNGKVIVQPSLFLGYTFVNTFDYKNSAGLNMDTDPLHAIQVIPGLKVIGNTKGGWQPYAGVDMVWNIMGQKNVMANDVRLPQLSVKPYIQYGVGVQKSWSNRFTAFFQTMIRNGGRNGIVLQVGFRWALGKDSANEKVQKNYNKVVLKQIK